MLISPAQPRDLLPAGTIHQPVPSYSNPLGIRTRVVAEHGSGFPRVAPLDPASVRGSLGALLVFLGTELHVSTAPFDCVRALLACAGLCSAHRESDTARSTSREPDNSYGDASVRRIGPI
jgi:hypothetical protein